MRTITIEKIKKIRKEMTLLKFMEIKPNYSELARIYKLDYRTVKRIYEENYNEKVHRNKSSKLEELDDVIREKMKYKGIKGSSLYNYLVEEYGYKGSYSSLTWYLRVNHIKKPSKENGKVFYETDAGEQLQFDWVEDITMINRNGEEFNFNVFSAELSYSRMHYFLYSITKTKEDVMKCLIKSFEYFNGTTQGILTDNMSSIVHNNSFCDEFKALAKDFNIKLNKCKVRHSWTKGKVEVRNKFMKWLIPYNNDFDTEEDLIRIIKRINVKVNDRINDRIGTKPIIAYQKEKEYLSPLPTQEIRNHYFDLKRGVKVTNVSTVYYKGCQYSVPSKFINKTLKVKEINNKLYIYNNTDLVTIHDITGNKINYKEEDYKEQLRKSMPNKDEDYINNVAKKNLELFGKLGEIKERK